MLRISRSRFRSTRLGALAPLLLLSSLGFRCPGPDPEAGSGGAGGGGTGGISGTPTSGVGASGAGASGVGGFGGFGPTTGPGGSGGTGGAGGGGCDPQMVDADPLNCGACGRPCGTANVDALLCDQGVCKSTCQSGFVNLFQPGAPVTDDGCEKPGRRVFVTSSPYLADFGLLLGALGADDLCQATADAQGLGGTWMAWISDSVTSPAGRFTLSSVPYFLVDGTVVANDWADLTDDSITVPINVDETGASVPLAEVWTGTDLQGFLSPQGATCTDWTDLYVENSADVGRTDSTDYGWTQIFWQQCSRTDVRLYCFEQ